MQFHILGQVDPGVTLVLLSALLAFGGSRRRPKITKRVRRRSGGD